MPYPVPIVEIAFDDSPYAVSPTWTDVTSWVRSLSTDRGRSDDWGDFYGSAQVVLNNRTRLFDPYYTSGTYYGKLLPRRQIRIRAQTNDTGTTVTHDVFRGFINGWNPYWTDAGTDSTVTLQCYDALQLLGSEQLPADWSRQYILSTSPRHYYPCDEPISPFTAGTVLNDFGTYPLNAVTSVYATNGNQLAVGLVNSSIQGTSFGSAISVAGAVSTTSSFSACFWAVLDPDGVYNPGGVMGNCAFDITFESATSTYFFNVFNYYDSRQHGFRTVSTFDGGTPRHLAFSYNPVTDALLFYVDGTLQSMTEPVHTGTFPFTVNEAIVFGTGQLQQFVVWNSIVAGSVFQEIYKYSIVNLPETTTARAQRIIAQTPFSSSLTSFPTSPASSVLDITDNAPAASEELRIVAASEGAPLFVSKNGTVTMFQQLQQFSQTASVTSQVTYGTGGADMGQVFELMPDGDSVRNVANITMSQGGVYTQENTTSVAAYGTASESVETQVQTYGNAQSLGNIITGWGGYVYPRLSPVDVVLDSANPWSPTLALELCDRITINAQPPSGGNAITVPMLVQNIQHQAVPGFWQTTLQGSARWAAVFIIGQSLIGGTDLLG